MSESLLLPLSTADFDRIPEKVVPRTVRLEHPALDSPRAIEWTAMGYATKLIDKNDRFIDLLTQFTGRLDDPAFQSRMTAGQRILLSLSTFDAQVKNGGITQFFWNCPDLIVEVAAALAALGEAELLESYNRAVNTLLGKHNDWVTLRKQWAQDADDAKWEPFQTSYELLDLDWFDEPYFKMHSPRLLKRIVEYVKAHRDEFIEPP